MFRAEYETKANRVSLYVYVEDHYAQDYQIPMLRHNSIEGILEIEGCEVSGKARYTYEIGGMISMKAKYENAGVKKQELQEIIMQLLKVSKELQNYMLDSNCLILNPEYIFYRNGQWFFCYLPQAKQDFQNAFHELTEYFLKMLDYADVEAVFLACELHKATLQFHYDLEEIIKEYEGHKKERETTIKKQKCDPDLKEDILWVAEEKVYGKKENFYEEGQLVYEEGKEIQSKNCKKNIRQIFREKMQKHLPKKRWGKWEDLIMESDGQDDSLIV